MAINLQNKVDIIIIFYNMSFNYIIIVSGYKELFNNLINFKNRDIIIGNLNNIISKIEGNHKSL